MSQEDKEELTLPADEFLDEENETGDTFCKDIETTTNRNMPQEQGNARSRLISEGSLEETLLKYDQDSVPGKTGTTPSEKASLWRLWRLNFKEWPYLIGVIVCSILKGLQLPVYAYIFGRFIQIFTSKDDFEVRNKGDLFAMMYTIIAAVVGLDGFLQHLLVGLGGEKFTYRMRKIIFSAVLDQDMSFFDNPDNTVGNLCARLSTDATSLRGVCLRME